MPDKTHEIWKNYVYVSPTQNATLLNSHRRLIQVQIYQDWCYNYSEESLLSMQLFLLRQDTVATSYHCYYKANLHYYSNGTATFLYNQFYSHDVSPELLFDDLHQN
jgi:hypothetical protein